MMQSTRLRLSPFAAALAALLACIVSPGYAGGALAADLEAVSDGEHLWLVQEEDKPEDADKPHLRLYHSAGDNEPPRLMRLDPVPGELMSRGIAAGDGRLLIVMADRRLETVRPVRSNLLQGWLFQRRTLAPLPDGCTLMSAALSSRGPWALVRVESADTLESLDQAGEEKTTRQPIDPAMLNLALGLPEDFELNPKDKADPDDQPEGQPENEAEPTGDDPQGDPADDEAPPQDQDEDQAQSQAKAKPTLPAYRLIHLRGGRWSSVALPEEFVKPKRAELAMRDADLWPTILFEPDDAAITDGRLLRMTPARPVTQASVAEQEALAKERGEPKPSSADADKPTEPTGWSVVPVPLQPGTLQAWSGAFVKRQLVVAVEQTRSGQAVTARVHLLRGGDALAIGELAVPSSGPARWSLMPWQDAIAMAVVPGPDIKPPSNEKDPAQPIAGLVSITLNGKPLQDTDDPAALTLYEAKPDAFDGNADLYIQITAFIVAMLMMIAFYRRATRTEQLDLQEGIVLASFGRRVIAGFIDLAPGFWLAGMLYGTTISETMLYWPGNGVPKALPAMRPGFVVIGVTLAHTTLAEVILARSLGKWATGLYVADNTGKPAAPGPALVRALSRCFELFAPLMLVLAVISPARQRLGDILAQTMVVMRAPEPKDDDNPNDDDAY